MRLLPPKAAKLGIVHPVLFALYPVLFLYSSNFGQTSFFVALWPMLLFPAVSMLLWLILMALRCRAEKAALLTSVVVILFCSFGHAHALLYQPLLSYERDVAGVNSPLLLVKTVLFIAISVVWLGLILAAAWMVRGKPAWLGGVTRFLNVASLALLALPLITLLYDLGSGQLGRDVETSNTEPMAQRRALDYKPDIYYIILDGYAREDVLKTFYGYDNSSFTTHLARLGFQVPPKTRSNYSWTFLSLASSLNMEHVNWFAKEIGEDSRNRQLPYRMIRDNEVARYLRKRGYMSVHLTSTWGATLANPYADIEISCGTGIFRIEFYRVLANSTWLRVLESSVSSDLAMCHLFNFQMLGEVAKKRFPKFVFAHFIPPHHPYLFDRDGNILRSATVSNQFEFRKHLWRDKAKYISQLEFVNQKVKEAVDAILANSERPPIIIIQSDHGPSLEQAPARIRKGVRLANFLAAYLPGAPTLLPDDITPVNLFPTILNYYFDDQLSTSPQLYYVSPYTRPYKLRLFDRFAEAEALLQAPGS